MVLSPLFETKFGIGYGNKVSKSTLSISIWHLPKQLLAPPFIFFGLGRVFHLFIVPRLTDRSEGVEKGPRNAAFR